MPNFSDSDFSSYPFETAVMTVDGYEHLGLITVRPRTIRDRKLTLPALTDFYINESMKDVERIRGEKAADQAQEVLLNPGPMLRYYSLQVAIAKCFIVDPNNLVDRLLKSENVDDEGFFEAFSEEYSKWMEARKEDALKKKSGTVTEPEVDGTRSVSLSENDTGFLQPIHDG